MQFPQSKTILNPEEDSFEEPAVLKIPKHADTALTPLFKHKPSKVPLTIPKCKY